MSLRRAPAAPAHLPASEVRAMFDRIAPRYDLLNRLMSTGRDGAWRAAAAAAADLAAGDRALDCCTGTGDLALALADRVRAAGRVVGVDFAPKMLELARRKAAARGHDVRFEVADITELPFADDDFDAATVAFGLRNVPQMPRALAEMARVVRPGGRVVVLDITAPRRLRALYEVWFDRVVPTLGGTIASDRAAYSYLPASARRFPGPEALATDLLTGGVEDVRWRTYAGGMVALHQGRVAR